MRRNRLTIVVAAISLFSCGGGSSEPASLSTAASLATSTSAATGGSSAPSTAAASSTTAKASSGSGSSDFDLVSTVNAIGRRDCSRAKELADRIFSERSDFIQDLAAIAEGAQRLAVSGPSELRADFALLVPQYKAVLASLDAAGIKTSADFVAAIDDPVKDEILSAAFDQLDEESYEGPVTRIADWVEARCPEESKS